MKKMRMFKKNNQIMLKINLRKKKKKRIEPFNRPKMKRTILNPNPKKNKTTKMTRKKSNHQVIKKKKRKVPRRPRNRNQNRSNKTTNSMN